VGGGRGARAHPVWLWRSGFGLRGLWVWVWVWFGWDQSPFTGGIVPSIAAICIYIHIVYILTTTTYYIYIHGSYGCNGIKYV
jgi:hypothetical protein